MYLYYGASFLNKIYANHLGFVFFIAEIKSLSQRKKLTMNNLNFYQGLRFCDKKDIY